MHSNHPKPCRSEYKKEKSYLWGFNLIHKESSLHMEGSIVEGVQCEIYS